MAEKQTEAREVREALEELEAPKAAPIVDPSPTQAPIMAGSSEYVFPPAEASPKEVLELKPNKYADAVSGPSEQISMVAYTTWTKPDGTSFVAPVANDETYARKGYKKGAVEDVDDIVAYMAERAKAKS